MEWINVETVLQKARSLASEEEEFRGMAAGFGVQRHLRTLIGELLMVQSVLSDAETQADSWEFLKNWRRKVNGVATKVDDLLDGLAYEFRRRLKVEFLNNKGGNKVRYLCALISTSIPVKRVKMIHQFNDVISRFKDIIEVARDLKIGLMGLMTVEGRLESNRIPVTRDFSVVESEIFRNIHDSAKLREIVLSAEYDGDLFFISLVGKVGIGKTTLAQAVFNDAEVVNHFDERMWVNVSVNFDVDRLLEDMFRNLTHNTTVLDKPSGGREAIMLKLLEKLEGKKYLLVLDDVWKKDLDLWDSFYNCLLQIGSSRGSKIIITTRSGRLADFLKPGLAYHLSLLPDEYCWKVFQSIAFAPGGPIMTQRLLGLGERIVQKCQGLPLAIKLVGGLLYTKKDERDWIKLAESSALGNSDSINDILKLCYDHLPSISLQRCFLHCSIFPQDSVMEKDELIQLWIAQGLLYPLQGNQGNHLSLEELGAQYLDFFVWTSMLQKFELDEFGRTKSYKMHDLLHDLASHLSRGYCSIMDGMNNVIVNSEAVHASLINCQGQISGSSRDNYTKLRTLRLVNCGILEDMFELTVLLRILIVVDSRVAELPVSISKLRLLHYLDVSKTQITKLPDSVSKLYNLQTLRLYDLLESPKDFENLVNLRRLYIKNFKDLDKLSVLPSRFQAIIDPSSFKASFKAYLHKNCPIEKLRMLLKDPDRYSTLRIYCLENVSDYEEATNAGLSSMSTIDCLQLHWNARRENCNDEEVLEGLQPHPNIRHLIIENYKGSVFPPWIMNVSQPLILHHLVKMELEDCSCCDQVPPLGHLPYLEIVKIIGMVNIRSVGAEFYGLKNLDDQSSSSCSAGAAPTFFPALIELTLREMACLEEWYGPPCLSNNYPSVCPLLEKFEVEQCPKLIGLPDIIDNNHKHLRRFEIALCDSLASLPEGFGRIQYLEDLDIRGLPSLTQLSIGCCDNLKSLTIGGFSSASGVDRPSQHAFGSRTSLHLEGGSGTLASLPEQLQYLSTLRYLTISGYGGLKSLPKWFSKLKCLKFLKLEFCWKLLCLPAAEEMQQLTDLHELDICYCPLLEERCTKGSRPEWYKISHIPRIKINSEEIKSRRQPRK